MRFIVFSLCCALLSASPTTPNEMWHHAVRARVNDLTAAHDAMRSRRPRIIFWRPIIIFNEFDFKDWPHYFNEFGFKDVPYYLSDYTVPPGNVTLLHEEADQHVTQRFNAMKSVFLTLLDKQ